MAEYAFQNPDGTDKSVQQVWLEEAESRGISIHEMLSELLIELEDARQAVTLSELEQNELAQEDVAFLEDAVATVTKMIHS